MWYNHTSTANDPLAQPVEHLTFNQGVRSSNLRRVTKNAGSVKRSPHFCGSSGSEKSVQDAGEEKKGGMPEHLATESRCEATTSDEFRTSDGSLGHHKQAKTLIRHAPDAKTSANVA